MSDSKHQWEKDPESALIQSGSRSGRSGNNQDQESKAESSEVDSTVKRESTNKKSDNDQVATTSSMSKNEASCKLDDRHKTLDDSDTKDARKWAQLPPIVKCVYMEDPQVSNMSTSQAAEWRRENFVMQVRRTIDNKSNLTPEQQPDLKPIPNPVLSFEHVFKNYPEIMEKIEKLGFKKPTPIQSQAWPILLGGEDLIATAPNGTGKTLAYLLPALIHIGVQIRPKEERRVPLVLILVPGKELAIQTHRIICNFKYKDIKSVCLYGGINRYGQIQVINKGVDIVVATPGRFKTLICSGYLYANNFTYIVFDEADKLFDTKLAGVVCSSLYSARPDHQRVLLSATWLPRVRTYIHDFIRNTTEITVGSLELATVRTVRQTIRFVGDGEKDKALLTFISNMSPTDKVIVFCKNKNAISHVTKELAARRIKHLTLHSGLAQKQREAAFNTILQGPTKILLATDIASRGIDLKDLTHVINYSFPRTLEDYVQRIGRTGRAEKRGTAITYMTQYDWKHANGLIKILKEANQEVAKQLEKYAERFELMMQEGNESSNDYEFEICYIEYRE